MPKHCSLCFGGVSYSGYLKKKKKKTSIQPICRAFDAISSFLIWVRAILKGWKLGEKDPHLSKQMTGSILKWTASKEKPMIQFKFP